MICGPHGGKNFRFTNKTVNKNERKLMQNYWVEMARMYGVYTDYFTYEYDITKHNFLYGEHTLAPFSGPKAINMLAQFNNDSLLLAKFGIRTDADATFIVPILTFRATFNDNNAEPKAGDLIRLTELGWDRPGGVNDINTITSETSSCSGYDENVNTFGEICNINEDDEMDPGDCNPSASLYSTYDETSAFDTLMRGAPVFEITERRDQDLTQNYNMLQGHYVWILHCKRFDYSYQPKAPKEPGPHQMSDDIVYGKLIAGTELPSDEAKIYDQNVDEESKRIWDYEKTPNSDNSVYGNY